MESTKTPEIRTSETLEEKIQRVLAEHIEVVSYNFNWPKIFEKEKEHLNSLSPQGIIRRVAHFGSTAVPGLAAKPVVDILVEVSSSDETKSHLVPQLEAEGYDYFWRPAFGDNQPPFYSWFIKRDRHGKRMAHLHMVEKDSELWERLLFRDYLITHPDIRDAYGKLKAQLALAFPHDRVAYTQRKSEFINEIMQRCRAAK